MRLVLLLSASSLAHAENLALLRAQRFFAASSRAFVHCRKRCVAVRFSAWANASSGAYTPATVLLAGTAEIRTRTKNEIPTPARKIIVRLLLAVDMASIGTLTAYYWYLVPNQSWCRRFSCVLKYFTMCVPKSCPDGS